MSITKSIRAFIKENRKELDAIIIQRLTQYDRPGFVRVIEPMNDEQRRQWVLNDEPLYNWARSEGVQI